MLELTTVQKIVLAVAIAALGGSSAYLYSASGRSEPIEQPLYQAGTIAEESAELVVQIAGAVNQPGLYRLAPGSRVYEAIRQAGGFTADADPEAINLAELVEDGQKIAVPSKPQPKPQPAPPSEPQTEQQPKPAPEPPPPVSAPQPTKPSAQPAVMIVNLNKANRADLEQVPGIGPILAQRIIAYRQRYGPFKTVYQLRLIEGIGQHTFDKIKPYVSVVSPTRSPNK